MHCKEACVRALEQTDLTTHIENHLYINNAIVIYFFITAPKVGIGLRLFDLYGTLFNLVPKELDVLCSNQIATSHQDHG